MAGCQFEHALHSPVRAMATALRLHTDNLEHTVVGRDPGQRQWNGDVVHVKGRSVRLLVGKVDGLAPGRVFRHMLKTGGSQAARVRQPHVMGFTGDGDAGPGHLGESALGGARQEGRKQKQDTAASDTAHHEPHYRACACKAIAFVIMQGSIAGTKRAHAGPEIYIDSGISDIRALEFHRIEEIFVQAKPARDELKRQLAELPGASPA